MKKVFITLSIALLLVGCSLQVEDTLKDGKLIKYEPPVVMGKFEGKILTRYETKATYYFRFYQENILVDVEVTHDTWNKFKVKDTIHGYTLIPK